MIPIPKPTIQRPQHRLHRLRQPLPHLRLHTITLVLLHEIVKGDVEGPELLLDRIALLGIQALDDGRRVGAGRRTGRRASDRLGRVLHVQQVLRRVLPGVRVHLLGVLAPRRELAAGRVVAAAAVAAASAATTTTAAELPLQLALPDHALYDAHVVGEEHAL